jgi:SAM-dependent methyltransferase
MRRMTSDDPRLGAVWPFVRSQLPLAPTWVLEVGCGTLGGFVPALLASGYHAVGVDPEAPEGPGYRQIEFERYEPPQPVDCVVASLSLHHVADLNEVLDRLGAVLAPGGVLVVVEWAWERFDEATARWCFARLASPNPGEEPGWLHKAQERWAASGQRWDDTFGPGRPRRGCTPARTSCGAWMRAFTVSCMWRARTSSPTWPTPARARSRPQSVLA